MSTVPQAGSARPAPPVRHGSARLEITINGQAYGLRRVKTQTRGARNWSLTHTGGPRAGVSHCVCRYQYHIACTCEDSVYRGALCKHMRALVAVGILSGRCRPVAASAVPAPVAKGGAL